MHKSGDNCIPFSELSELDVDLIWKSILTWKFMHSILIGMLYIAIICDFSRSITKIIIDSSNFGWIPHGFPEFLEKKFSIKCHKIPEFLKEFTSGILQTPDMIAFTDIAKIKSTPSWFFSSSFEVWWWSSKNVLKLITHVRFQIFCNTITPFSVFFTEFMVKLIS